MYVCMYVWVCMYVCMYICMYVCVGMYLCLLHTQCKPIQVVPTIIKHGIVPSFTIYFHLLVLFCQ